MLFAAVNRGPQAARRPRACAARVGRSVPGAGHGGERARRIGRGEAGTILLLNSSSRTTRRPARSKEIHESDRARARAADPRQSRKPDGRGRAEPAIRRVGPGCRPVGRIDRRVRGDRAPRRGSGLDGQGRLARGRQRQRRDRHRGAGAGRLQPGGARSDADPARRHAEQIAARRERDPRRVAGRGARGGRRAAAAAVALPRRRDGARPAGADDERAQRRRPRRQRHRLPGVHDRPRRRANVQRGIADGRRGVPLR